MEVALAISKGTLQKHINKLVSSELSWLTIKAQLQERFSECGSTTMAKHKLTQLKQSELPMYEYITKFDDIVEHTHTASSLLTVPVSFWFPISLRVCKTLMSKITLGFIRVKILKDIFGHAIQEDQKQKIRALDFGVAPHSETTTTTNCSINAIMDKG